MTSERRPRIAVINDDGITAKGIQSLAEAMTDFGDVYVIAPDSPQSGMGHAVTFSSILKLHPFEFGRGVTEARACSGTPVDCVKLAVAEVFGEDNLPDLLVSGINHGSNASINVIYSGTMSAAVEGAMCGIPSIGFSLLDERWDADFSASVEVAKTVVRSVLEHGLPSGTCLNVNIPKVAKEDLKGIRICRQAMGHWRDTFDQRATPGGNPYYWMPPLTNAPPLVAIPTIGCAASSTTPTRARIPTSSLCKKATPVWSPCSLTSPPTTPLEP